MMHGGDYSQHCWDEADARKERIAEAWMRLHSRDELDRLRDDNAAEASPEQWEALTVAAWARMAREEPQYWRPEGEYGRAGQDAHTSARYEGDDLDVEHEFRWPAA